MQTCDIPCSITLRSAGGVSFQSAGPTTPKAASTTASGPYA